MLNFKFFFLCFLILNIFTQSIALYENDDRITVLTASNFTNFVNTQPTLVQFYLHSCGACINYALIFKNFSKSIENWRWAIKLAVVDCDDPGNEMIHVNYNISSFPTFLLFLKANEIIPFPKISNESTFRKTLSEALVNGKQHDQLLPGWTNSDALKIYGPDTVEIAMIILDFKLKSPFTFQSDQTEGPLYGVKESSGRNLFSSEDVVALRNFIEVNYLAGNELPINTTAQSSSLGPEKAPIPVPHSMPVYTADIISSLQHLRRDISFKSKIEGDDMNALKEFLVVLSKYLDLGRPYNKEIQHLTKSVNEKLNMSGQEWLNLTQGMKLFTVGVDYIACRGSKAHLRGYPCGLWLMFHSMVANRYFLRAGSDEAAPIAHALNRFVPRFFSCTECAFHFARMTANVRREGESVYPVRAGVKPPFLLEVPDPATLPTAPKSAREEVLWLNAAHNIVNKRLSGKPSEDPAAPKAVFPSPEQCGACWSEDSRRQLKLDKFAATPDQTEELLAYLVRHYRPSYYRWDGISVRFEDIPQMDLAMDTFSTADLVLVGVICVCCSAALTALFAFICCKWRCSKRNLISFAATA